MSGDVVIFGYGVLGRTTGELLIDPSRWLEVVDPAYGHKRPSYGATTAIVATPAAEGLIEADVLDALAEHADLEHVVVRSTVKPIALELLAEALDARVDVSVWPEFLTERTAAADALNPDKVVLGVANLSRALDLLALIRPEVRAAWSAKGLLVITNPRAAAIAKLTINATYTVKALLANLTYDVAGVDYPEVLEVLRRDRRLTVSHENVWADGYRGVGGKCLPKDTGLFAELLDRPAGVDVFEALLKLNLDLRASRP